MGFPQSKTAGISPKAVIGALLALTFIGSTLAVVLFSGKQSTELRSKAYEAPTPALYPLKSPSPTKLPPSPTGFVTPYLTHTPSVAPTSLKSGDQCFKNKDPKCSSCPKKTGPKYMRAYVIAPWMYFCL